MGGYVCSSVDVLEKLFEKKNRKKIGGFELRKDMYIKLTVKYFFF